jgi:ABC-type multidrug transport system fused ATPase/permease subunit
MRRILFTALVLLIANGTVNAQKPYISDASIEEQLEFVEEEASSWNQYVMIFDTWFTRLKTNINDTIKTKNSTISRLESTIVSKDSAITALNNQLDTTNKELQQTIREKDAFTFLGMNMQKSLFISIVIFIFFVLLAVAGMAVFILQRSNMASRKMKKELDKMKNEFEDHRQRSRQKYEALVVQHHKEIQKLKE